MFNLSWSIISSAIHSGRKLETISIQMSLRQCQHCKGQEKNATNTLLYFACILTLLAKYRSDYPRLLIVNACDAKTCLIAFMSFLFAFQGVIKLNQWTDVFFNLLPAMTITALNAILPFVFRFIASRERYDSPRVTIEISLFRYAFTQFRNYPRCCPWKPLCPPQW